MRLQEALEHLLRIRHEKFRAESRRGVRQWQYAPLVLNGIRNGSCSASLFVGYTRAGGRLPDGERHAHFVLGARADSCVPD